MPSLAHSHRAHAKLSASGSSRWLNCTASPTEEEKYAKPKSSAYAEEGTKAHELAEFYVLKALGRKAEKPSHSDSEMERHAASWADYVSQEFDLSKALDGTAIVRIEHRVDLSEFVPGGFGTCDAIIIADGTLKLIDYKYGKGVRVDAESNTQLMLYALGAYHFFELSYAIDRVELHIFQPRLDHIDVWALDAVDLLHWADNVVKPKAQEAADGPGVHVPGAWCRWCAHKHACRALADKATNHAKAEFSPLSEPEMVEHYKNLEVYALWHNALKEHMLSEALAGKSWPGLKLVAGRSIRKISDEKQAIQKLVDLGHEPNQITKVKLKGLTELQKLLGGQEGLNQALAGLIVKPEGKPSLVLESDKRKPLPITPQEEFKNEQH